MLVTDQQLLLFLIFNWLWNFSTSYKQCWSVFVVSFCVNVHY